MDAFNALAEPRRRKIVEMLASQGQMSSTEISQKFEVTAQAISQHLRALLDAKLVTMKKQAQQHIYQINPAPMAEIAEWLRDLERRLNESLDRLDLAIQSEKKARNGEHRK